MVKNGITKIEEPNLFARMRLSAHCTGPNPISQAHESSGKTRITQKILVLNRLNRRTELKNVSKNMIFYSDNTLRPLLPKKTRKNKILLAFRPLYLLSLYPNCDIYIRSITDLKVADNVRLHRHYCLLKLTSEETLPEMIRDN